MRATSSAKSRSVKVSWSSVITTRPGKLSGWQSNQLVFERDQGQGLSHGVTPQIPQTSLTSFHPIADDWLCCCTDLREGRRFFEGPFWNSTVVTLIVFRPNRMQSGNQRNATHDIFSANPIQLMSQIWQSVSERNRAESPLTSTILYRRLKLYGRICRANHDATIMPVRSRPPSTVYQRIGDVQAVVLASPGCKQSKETSLPRISASPQLSVSHIHVPAGIVLRKQHREERATRRRWWIMITAFLKYRDKLIFLATPLLQYDVERFPDRPTGDHSCTCIFRLHHA